MLEHPPVLPSGAENIGWYHKAIVVIPRVDLMVVNTRTGMTAV